MAANQGLNTGAPSPSAPSIANANTASDTSAPYSALAESTMGGYTEGGTRTPEGLDGGFGFNLDLPTLPGYENDGDSSVSGTPNEYDIAAGVVDSPANADSQTQSDKAAQNALETQSDTNLNDIASDADNSELGADGKPLPFNEHPAWQRRIAAEKAAKDEAASLRAELQSIRDERQQAEEAEQYRQEEARIAEEVEARNADRFDLEDDERQHLNQQETAREMELRRREMAADSLLRNYQAQQETQHLQAAETEFPALADSVEIPGANGQTGTFTGTQIARILYGQQMALWQTQSQQAQVMGQQAPPPPDLSAIARDFGRYVTAITERTKQAATLEYQKTKTTKEAQTPTALGADGGGGAIPAAAPKTPSPTGRTIFGSIKLPF